MTGSKRTEKSFYVSLTFTVVALVFALMHIFHFTLWDKKEPTFDKVVVGILIAAVLPWVIDRIEVIKGGGFEIRQRLDVHDQEIATQQKKLADQQEQLAKQQEQLNDMFFHSMERDIFDTLKNLLVQETFTHNPDDPYYSLIIDQMKHLFQLGYLKNSPEELRAHQEIGQGRILTDAGKRFVEARTKLRLPEDSYS